MHTIHRPIPTKPDAEPLDAGFLEAVVAGAVRLTPEQSFRLYTEAPLHTLARVADGVCRRIHGPSIRTYVKDRNINYTNVCTARCTFCAFRRDGDEADAYTLEHSAIEDKVAELVAIGGTQILMQGGMNPALPISWYEELLRRLKSKFPQVHIHAFSPPEFIEFVEYFDPPGDSLESKLKWVMVRLREAGLDSIPGGGGEIFAAPVRRKIGLGKCDAEAWLTTMFVAHQLGMFTSATMMFGHIEGLADRVHHLELVRSWQDKALTELPGAGEPGVSGAGHYKAFISWPFQRENTPLGRLPEWGDDPAELERAFPGDVVARLDGEGDARAEALFGRRARMAGATEYLRTQALSRIHLDNIYSIGASWVTMGPAIGQVGLRFGANDMGSVMMEENVVSAAGTTYCLDEQVLCRLIREAGFVPAQRDNTYDLLRIHDGPESPDLLVRDWSAHRTKRLHIQGPTNSAGSAPVELTTSLE
ncbi:MAG: radical SAM protein [Phycisphaeraceae bacterium]|nr:radical SAM protein [Phycisphaeraceae bacterium]MCB9847969.1 radical SAM protein [Phycisphaeraceae bacterium]